MNEPWSSVWQELYSRCKSCPARTLSPPPSKLIAVDSHHVSPSVDTLIATCTYLHSPLSSLTPQYPGQFWATQRQIYDWLLSMQWDTKGKRVVVQVERENKITEEGRSAPSPPGGFHLQEQHLGAQSWVMPPTDTPISLEAQRGTFERLCPSVLSKIHTLWCICGSDCPHCLNGKLLIYLSTVQLSVDFFLQWWNYLLFMEYALGVYGYASLQSKCCMISFVWWREIYEKTDVTVYINCFFYVQFTSLSTSAYICISIIQSLYFLFLCKT